MIQYTVFAQLQTEHEVSKGESIYSIAKKYGISEEAIYELNPSVKGSLLQLKSILLISKKNYKKKNVDFHIINKGDTFFSISKKYELSISELRKLNPSVAEKNLKLGDKIHLKKYKNIASQSETEQIIALNELEEEEKDDSGEITHVIKKGETLFSISKKYGLNVSQIEQLNPRLSNKLKIGYNLIIKKGINTSDTIVSAPSETSLENEQDDTEDIAYIIENGVMANQLIGIATQQIGTRYRGGGTSSGGFDCSGLMFFTFNQLDFKLPRSSNDQSQIGKKISKKKAQKGDLIFFTTNGRGTINHVGMITEVFDDEILFIHSSVQSGVIVSSTNEAYYSKRFKTIKRILPLP
jgi:cell wall-associated NlpC family hydrolase